MKTRTVVLVALAVLLAGGGAYLLTYSTEAPDEGAAVKAPAKKAKATKVVKAAAPKPESKTDNGLMTGSIDSFAFSDTLSEEPAAQ